jgi:hypothetical protein
MSGAAPKKSSLMLGNATPASTAAQEAFSVIHCGGTVV